MLDHARSAPTRPAIRDRDGTFDYAELADEVRKLASALKNHGMQPGDRLVIWAHKRRSTVATLLASLHAGLVIVPVAPQMRPAQVKRIISDSGAAGMIVDGTHRQWLDNTAYITADSLWFARDVAGSFMPFDTDAASGSDETLPPAAVDGSDLAALFYTSGSTGMPKGVMVTHDNLAIGTTAVCDYLQLHADDRLLGMLPLSFDYGFSQLTTAIHAGACLQLADYLLPGDFKRPLLEDGVTVVAGTPGLLIPLSRQSWLAQAPALRIITNSGGHLPVASVQAFRNARPQTRLFLMYGLTEAFRASFLPPAEVDDHPDSMGRAFAVTRLGLVDDHGTLLPPGSTGELVQGGPLVTAGYYNDPDATAARFRPPPAGWPYDDEHVVVYSGDRVHMDESGRLYFRGRIDDQIKTAGFRVSPAEIESVALACPGVTEALAYAIADETLGARIGLAIAPTDVNETTLRARLRDELAPHQQPAHIRVMTSLPRSTNGKLDRRALMTDAQLESEADA